MIWLWDDYGLITKLLILLFYIAEMNVVSLGDNR